MVHLPHDRQPAELRREPQAAPLKIAITGGTGFVGAACARALRESGHQPVVLSRRTGTAVGDPDGLTAGFAGCAAVIHCAGINREIGGQTYEHVHVRGTQNVVDAARRAGVGKVVLMSFLRARPDCGSGYHESKWAAEEIVRASGLDFTVVKAGVIYGRGDHMLDHLSHALHTLPVFGLVGFRELPVRPTAVADMARVLVAAAADGELPRATVPVTGPEQLSLEAAVRRVADVVGKRPLFVRMPVWFHYGIGWLTERLMHVPLVSLAQVRILSEGLVEPAGAWEPLPPHLTPQRRFTRARIAAGLPEPKPFGCRDLRCAS